MRASQIVEMYREGTTIIARIDHDANHVVEVLVKTWVSSYITCVNIACPIPTSPNSGKVKFGNFPLIVILNGVN